jgi:hypothetical protein
MRRAAAASELRAASRRSSAAVRFSRVILTVTTAALPTVTSNQAAPRRDKSFLAEESCRRAAGMSLMIVFGAGASTC